MSILLRQCVVEGILLLYIARWQTLQDRLPRLLYLSSATLTRPATHRTPSGFSSRTHFAGPDRESDVQARNTATSDTDSSLLAFDFSVGDGHGDHVEVFEVGVSLGEGEGHSGFGGTSSEGESRAGHGDCSRVYGRYRVLCLVVSSIRVGHPTKSDNVGTGSCRGLFV